MEDEQRNPTEGDEAARKEAAGDVFALLALNQQIPYLNDLIGKSRPGGRPQATPEQIAQRDAMMRSVRQDMAERPSGAPPPLPPDPYWLSPDDCDCRRLTRPLGRQDPLPDHVCRKTIGLAGGDWVRGYEAVDGGGPLVIPFANRSLHAFPGGRGWDDWPFVYVGGPLDAQTGVPIPAGGVLMILRQWADEGDEKLAREILGRPAVADYRRRLARAGQRASPQPPLTEGEVEAFRAERLPTLGVPMTPATARFLLWELHGRKGEHGPPEVPTRGPLVTTLLVIPWLFNSACVSDEGATPLQDYPTDSRWDDLIVKKAADVVAKQHRDWLGKMRFQFNTYLPQRHNTGVAREVDVLNDTIDDNWKAFRAGALTEDRLLDLCVDNRNEDHKRLTDPPASLNPNERKAVRDAARKRIKRRLAAENRAENK